MPTAYRRFAFLSVLLIAMSPLLASGEPDARPMSPAVAQATERLAAIDDDLETLGVRVERARGFAPVVPAGVAEELDRVKPRVREAVSLVFGLHWTEVAGTLEAAQRIERKLSALRESLKDWPSSPPAPTTSPDAPAPAGAITGVVTDETTGLPLANVSVYLYPRYVLATTGADGRWIVTGLSTGVYRAYTSSVPNGYVQEVFRDLPCWNSCYVYDGTEIAVTDGAITTGVDFSLKKAGGVSGRVTDLASGQGVGGVVVRLYWNEGSYYSYSSAQTAADGTYAFQNLSPGTYFLLTRDSRYTDELYDGFPCEQNCTVSDGTPVVVASGGITPGIDFALQLGGSVAGTVTSAATGEPLSNIEVTVWNSNVAVASAYTGSNGTYSVPGLPAGTYYATTDSWSSYADQLYDGLPCEPGCAVTSGTPIVVALGETTENVDFSLSTYGAFRGRVLDSSTGFPVDYAEVLTYRADGTLIGYDYADETGGYVSGGLLAGTYFAVASSGTHLDELWDAHPCQPSCDPTTGTPIAVTFGQTRDGIDFGLDLGGGVTGRVTEAVTGESLNGVPVEVFDAAGMGVWSDYTNGFGSYAARDLPAGTYFARLRKTKTHLGQLWNGLPCEGDCAVTVGTPIPVSTGSATTGVDFALVSLGKISGTVTDAITGQPIGGIYVTVYNASGTYLGYRYTSANGTYRVTGLTAGNYFARADASGYVAQLYDGIACPTPCTVTGGTPIPVALSAETPGVDFALVPYGKIAGTIRDAVTGLPLSYRNVAIHDADGDIVGYAYSGAGGTYSYSGLQPGSYFVATTGSTDYVDELWENLDCGAPCDVTRGTPVVVAFGVITSGIDFDLRLPYFSDVPLDHWARRYIEAIFVAGITSGCGPGVYCPTRSLSRAEMSVLLLLAEHGSAYVPPAPTGSIFTDVPADHWAGAFIEALAAEGVTSGCGAGNYCPDNPITRAELAVFLLAAKHGPGWTPPVPTGTVFGDVSVDHWAAAYIEALAAEGITTGCGAGNYCPDSPVSRAEMAVFLTLTFALPLN